MMLTLIKFPGVAVLRVRFAIDLVPFVCVLSSVIGTYLGMLLFIPFNFFLPVL